MYNLKGWFGLPTTVKEKKTGIALYWGWIVFVAIGAVFVLAILVNNMSSMVKFATILSFLTAPILAFLNLMVVYGKTMPKEARPGKFILWIAVAGLIFLRLLPLTVGLYPGICREPGLTGS